MAEKLEIFDLKGKSLGFKDRDAFYTEARREYAQKGKVTKQVKTIRALVMNSAGRIYLQKRSKSKADNAGLYDKSVEGHVIKDTTFEMTLVKECAEELGFPASIVLSADFEKAVRITDLSIVGIFRQVEQLSNFQARREQKDGTKYIQPYITAMFVGYYNGAIRFVDGESSGVEVFSLDELKEEIKKYPGKFTEDLLFLIKKYAKFLKPLH